MTNEDSLNNVLNHFKRHGAPKLLIELLEFDMSGAVDFFCSGFEFHIDIETPISTYWCEDINEAFDERIFAFALATGSGSLYALWRHEADTPLEESPVIFLGDEGEVGVIAASFNDFINLLTLDSELYPDREGCFIFTEPSEVEKPSPRHEDFKRWLDAKNISKMTPNEVFSKANISYKVDFFQWFHKYNPDLKSEDFTCHSAIDSLKDEAIKTCSCCRETKAGNYNGPIYSSYDSIASEDLSICFQCIKSGKAHDTLGVTFNAPEDFTEADCKRPDMIEEVCYRTPSYSSWQHPVWLSHCGFPCCYSGETTFNELTECEIQSLMEFNQIDDEYISIIKENPLSVGLHKFTCIVCCKAQILIDLS